MPDSSAAPSVRDSARTTPPPSFSALETWYALDGDEVLARLNSEPHGLSDDDARARLEQAGPNEIEFKKTPAWQRFLAQFYDPMVIILLVTATVTGTLTALGSHMLPDTIVIFGVVILNALLGFVQEGKAEGALDALRNMMVQECMVIRLGDQRKIPARELVPGDIVSLDIGDKVPADVRILESTDMHLDESSLTGESIPVLKRVEALSGSDLVPGDQSNMGFSGTYVTRGAAVAVVTATGANTVFGRIAGMVKDADKGMTPLQRKMKEFVRTLIFAILAVGAFNFVYGTYAGYSVGYSFLGAVSLVVAAIPEMLPALVTSILALSGTVMAGRKALIRRLPAAETLGATSVICSDKTGTLTENRMTVTQVRAGGRDFAVTGHGYDIEGEFQHHGQTADFAEEPALLRLLEVGFFCNNAHVGADRVSGDPTEVALKIAGAKAELISEGVRRLAEIPFDSSAKYMATLVDTGAGRFVFVKGAPEVVVKMCQTELDARGELAPLDVDGVLHAANAFASEALRTIGVAFLEVDGDTTELLQTDLQQLCFIGLEGMIDPPRDAAIEAVEVCKGAGIRTVMITGDHPATAQAVARQLGIEAQRAMVGAEITHLDDEQLRDVVKEVSVFARVAPEHKQRIAEALQSHDLVVAMTGDGVNDAPALKAADIGIAMGISGTEVAKESSDMVLADDNFATIVAAVEEGRHAWNNLRKAILYTLPTNAAQALLILGAVLLAAYVPVFSARFVLEPVQILWINLLDSILLTLPLMMERKEEDLLGSPPRPANEHIINTLFVRRVVLVGIAIAAPGFFIYHHFGAAAVVDGEIVDALLLTQAQTAAFWAILLAHFGYLISARSVHRSVFRINPFGNRWLLAGIATSIAIRFVPTIVPEAASLFRTASFPAEWWPLILLAFLPSFLTIEADKLLDRLGKRG